MAVTTYFVRMVSIIILLISLCAFALYQFYWQARMGTDVVIIEQVTQLVDIFKRIDKTCDILAIERDRSVIDFLNVKTFAGFDVGCLHVKFPQRWEGAYLENNYSVQGKLYEIIKTKYGYFLVPGAGIKLGSGKVIGRDIVFDYDTNIDNLIYGTRELLSYDKPLAHKLEFAREEEMYTLKVLLASPSLENA